MAHNFGADVSAIMNDEFFTVDATLNGVTSVRIIFNPDETEIDPNTGFITRSGPVAYTKEATIHHKDTLTIGSVTYTVQGTTTDESGLMRVILDE